LRKNIAAVVVSIHALCAPTLVRALLKKLRPLSTVRPSARSLRSNTMDRVLIDACRPYQWLDEFPPVNAFSKEYKRGLAEKWQV